ncbi:MAG: hypothetical protein Q4B81_05950 [Moraxella sp.]|nr:hypothetical protein [Moraxella sp.]
MGYDARVHCRCFQDDKIPRPYFSDFIKYDNDGLSLYLPEYIKNDENQSRKIEDDFDDWLENGCKHEGMHLATEYLTNIAGMAQFRQFVANHSNIYPILHQYLPTVNGGTVPAHLAKNLLQELTHIQNRKDTSEKIFLKEVGNDDYITHTHINTQTLFILTSKPTYYFYLGNRGFFIGDSQDYLVFESLHFYQEKLGDNQFIFTDIKTGKNFHFHYGIVDKSKSEFIVSKEQVLISEDFTYIVTPLIKVVKASIDTGNPIHWC